MRDPTKAHFDAVRFGRGLLAIHGHRSGERSIEFERMYDVYDLFDPRIGWPRTQSILLPLRPGETRLLRLTPATSESLNEPAAPAEADAPAQAATP